MSRYTPPRQDMDLLEWLQAGCALLLIGLTALGLVVLVLEISGVVR